MKRSWRCLGQALSSGGRGIKAVHKPNKKPYGMSSISAILWAKQHSSPCRLM